eukprot:CAMPEP_0172865334 /NCGR_PEP_ID=MMETSP1075-20121228/81351_1 /TAXON_ID=2916 /ORGANISM="Ceratium fusus, Strain PA161109" /LENGTH=90 /DNA_ID=CAMNT_0013714357 /DNA_START=12 /DNA_END=284 /DNA_ORIENTATION=+
MAEEAAETSKRLQGYMVDFLKVNNGSCSYGALVEEMEKHACDTVGAQLKILKKRGVLTFNGQFLMFPVHKDEVITLVQKDDEAGDAASGS